MEATRASAQPDAPLDDLHSLVAGAGPVLTAVLATEGDIEQAADRSEVAWGAQRRAAEELGAPAAALEAIDRIVPDAHLAGPRRFVVAAADGIRWSEPLAGGNPLVAWSPLPRLLPLIEDRQRRIPVLLARCDRRGVDLSRLEPLTAEDLGSLDDVEPHERKVQAGGWSMRRYHQRAERSLEGTAEEITEALVAAAMARDNDAVVVLAGDERTVESVAGRLPGGLDVRRVAGGRSPDGSDHQVIEGVDRIRGTVAAERTTAALRELRERLGRDQAVQGAQAVLLALAEGRVQRLLVAPPRDGAPMARFDPRRGMPDFDDGSVGDGHPQEAPLPDVAVRAALSGGASVRVVPAAAGPRDGLGALLRWDQPA